MKQCPKCQQLFVDENLRFCRFDGSSLISEATPPHEAPTILIPTGYLNYQPALLDELRHRSESGKLSK